MRRGLLLLSMLVVAASVWSAESTTRHLKTEVEIQERILADQLAELERLQGRAQEAWVRVQNAGTDLLRAHQQGESLESLQLRDEDLRLAEAELMMDLMEAQRLRRAVAVSRQTLEEQLETIRRLQQRTGAETDPITGVWDVIMEPGGQRGLFELRLDGTLIQGTYRLDGDWNGSLRGTLVANKVRLERIDSQLGFAAILYGRVVVRGDEVRIDGNWESTQVAAGLPAAGTWVARRLDPEDVE